MDFCEHCLAPDEVARWLRTPLRQLTADQLMSYSFNALGTCGDEDDFAYFLPRSLELVATGEHLFPDQVLGTVGSLWTRWSASQRDAVEAFAFAWWRRTLSAYGSSFEARSVLENIGVLDVPAGPYLQAWERAGDEAAARHLARLVFWFSEDDSTAWSRDIGAWLWGPFPEEFLLSAAAAATDPAVAADLADAYDYLMGLGKYRVG
jgi:hypothetical protein